MFRSIVALCLGLSAGVPWSVGAEPVTVAERPDATRAIRLPTIGYTDILTAGKTPEPSFADDNFGSAIAIDGDVGIVGAYTADEPLSQSGAAYIISRDVDGRWQLGQTLAPTDVASLDAAGSSVAIAGEYVFVGAPNDDQVGPDAGAVYVFRRNASTQQYEVTQKLTSGASLGSYQHYGRQLAASNGRVVVAADVDCNYRQLDVLTLAGGLWSATELVDAGASTCERFGAAVAIDGDRIAVTSSRGAALFERAGAQWTRVAQLDATVDFSWNGSAIALSGDSLAVADRAFANEFSAGLVAIFGFDANAGTWLRRRTWEGSFEYHNCGGALALRSSRLVIVCDNGRTAYQSRRHAVHFLQRNAGDPTRWDDIATLSSAEVQPIGPVGASARSAAVFASDDRVLVGDSWAEKDGPRAGYVRSYVFDGAVSPFSDGFLVRSDSGYGETYGWSVAQRGEWMFVGAIGDNAMAEQAGRVYVYRRQGDTWELAQQLTPDPGPDTQYFGTSVAIGEGFAAVGGSGIRDSTGARAGGVHIYALSGDTWTRSAFLQPVVGSSSRFGRSMAVDGTRLAIGAPTFVLTGPATGHVFIYERGTDASQWSLAKQISRTATGESRPFGYSLALRGDVLVSGDNRGGTWVYERHQGGAGQWGLVQALDIPFVGLTSQYNVAVDNDSIAVGVVNLAVDGGDQGEVRLFRRDGSAWTLSQIIARPPSSGGIARFGTAVAMSGDWLGVGGSRLHQNPNAPVIDLDSAYVRYFRRDAAGQFGPYGDTAFDVPLESYPEAIESPIAIGANTIAIGVPAMAGVQPPNVEYVGAVLLVETTALPLFVGGFE